MPHLKISKNMILGQINWKKKKKLHLIWKYGQILTIQKSLIIKQLRFSKKRFFIWVYHLVLHYILSPNNNFGMWINIIFHFVMFQSNNHSMFFYFKSPLLLTNEIFITK
jgi:hypothetical protein